MKTIFIILISSFAVADIDPLRGAFKLEASDYGISRIYSSRSLHIGLFGFGWCSEIDQKVELTFTHEVLLNHCGIVKRFKQLPRKPRTYVAQNGDRLIYLGSSWVYFVGQIPQSGYLKNGQPTWIRINNRMHVQLLYSNQNLHEIRVNHIQGLKVTLTQNNRFIEQLRGQGKSLLYRYQNFNLIEDTKKYHYDFAHNLTKITSGGSETRIAYSNQFDRVESVNTPDCSTELEYREFSTIKKVKYLRQKNLNIYHYSYSAEGRLLSVDRLVMNQRLKLIKRKQVSINYNRLGGFVGFNLEGGQ